MMENEDRELIQAAVDGELDAEQQVRLDALLADSDEARELHEELTSLAALLARVPGVEPPDALHAQIIENVKLPQASGLRSLFSFSDLPGFLRYGLAATAAVVLTVAVYRGGSEMDPSTDYADMVGTIARGGPVAGGAVIDSFRLDEGGSVAEVKLLERQGVYALEFQLNSEEPLQFDVDFSGNGLAFDAFARQDQDLEAVSWSGDTLSARARGDQRFVILMRRTEGSAESGARIGLEISRQGETIRSGWLEPGW